VVQSSELGLRTGLDRDLRADRYRWWRTWNIDARGTAMRLWVIQMGLNFLWPPTFFSLRWPALALAVIAPLFAAILAFIVRQWRSDRISSFLFLPYVAWIAFASLLNLAIVILN
jgi:translocator protein